MKITTILILVIINFSLQLNTLANKQTHNNKPMYSKDNSSKPVYSKDLPHKSKSYYPNAIIETMDKNTNIILQVSNNGEFLRAIDVKNEPLWEINVIKEFGGEIVGFPVIRNLLIKDDGVIVTIGKHAFMEIKLNNGKIYNVGSD